MVHNQHFLLVTFPAQGHLNPTIQFAKRLIRLGAQVTIATSVSAQRRMSKIPDGLTFTFFSDGYDDGFKHTEYDSQYYMSELKCRGSESLSEFVSTHAEGQHPVTCLVYTILFPWAAEVARKHNISYALLWIQPATVFDLYYYYFDEDYNKVLSRNDDDPLYSVQLPGLPTLGSRDLPSFLISSNAQTSWLDRFREQFDELALEGTRQRVLVNTFDALELNALRAVAKFHLTGVGPLLPSAILDGKDPDDTSFGGDLFSSTNDYVKWLNTKEKSSVVYISFGSLAVLEKRQMEEIAHGLIQSDRPFLWVIRKPDERSKGSQEDEIYEAIHNLKEEMEKGLIVTWCSQVEVLGHPSVGCFVTHCGWNSTLESLAGGVPVIAFPQWTDQGTNAKLIEDIWKTGVRVQINKEKLVESEELQNCISIVMGGGERGEELKKNARKWKYLAKEAVEEGGSSDKNLRRFLDDVQ